MNIKGKVIKMSAIETFGKDFQKMTFVIETAENYPQKIQFELHKERCNLLLETDLNREIDVHFDVKGKEYNEKYYNSLVAWKIERAAQLPTFEGKWLSGAIAKIKSGEQTVDFFNNKYNLTMEQFAAMKAAVPAKVDCDFDELPF